MPMSKNKNRAYYVFTFVVIFSVLLFFSERMTLIEMVLLFFISIPIYALGIYHGKKKQRLRALHRTKKAQERKDEEEHSGKLNNEMK